MPQAPGVIDELYQMLALLEGPQVAADRARLATLRPKDKYLAVTKLQSVRAVFLLGINSAS